MNLAKTILSIIDKGTVNRKHSYKAWEKLVVFLCAEETKEIEKYFPIKEKDDLIKLDKLKNKSDKYKRD